MNNMVYSPNGRAMTEQFEGLRLTSYQDSVGVWTIGYGHTSGVAAGMTCTQEQADAWLAQDVEGAAYVVNSVVTAPLNQNQFDALVDFVFNLGSGNFQSSTLLKYLNQGDYQDASGQFPLWNHAGGVVVAGLTARRLAEQKLFDTPITLPTNTVEPSAQTPAAQPTLVQQLQSWVQALQSKFGK
jgi:lysozyme